MRNVRWLVTTALVLASGVAPPHASAAGCAAVRAAGKWTTTSYPAFPSDTAPYRGYGAPIHAAGSTPSEVFVTNGVFVMRTADGGCTWSTVFDLATTGVSLQSSTDANVMRAYNFAVLALHVVATRVSATVDPRTSVYLLITAGGSTSTAPSFLAVSRDDGKTWRVDRIAASCEGAPSVPLVGIHDVLVSGPSTAYAYATGRVTADPGTPGLTSSYPYLLSTTDAGATWQCVRAPEPGTVVADPGEPRRLWDVSCLHVRRTDDRGVNWTTLRLPWPLYPVVPHCNSISYLDAFRPRRGPAQLLVAYWNQLATGTELAVVRSLDGGATWRAVPSPVMTKQQAVQWAGLSDTGQPVVLMAEGLVNGPSSPSGYTLRTYDDKRRGWSLTTNLAERIAGCDKRVLLGVRLVGHGDPGRATTLLTGDVDYARVCPSVLIRYDPRRR